MAEFLRDAAERIILMKTVNEKVRNVEHKICLPGPGRHENVSSRRPHPSFMALKVSPMKVSSEKTPTFVSQSVTNKVVNPHSGPSA